MGVLQSVRGGFNKKGRWANGVEVVIQERYMLRLVGAKEETPHTI